MSSTELLVRLRELHEQLAGINYDVEVGDHIDEETIDALGQLVTDVGELADRAKQAIKEEEPDVFERHHLLERIMQFETKHPTVIRFLSQMTDVLAMMGI